VIYDISPPLSSTLAVWPGDTPLSREVLCDMARGDNITLSTLRGTVHLGAHADAPSHYGKDDPTIEERSLDYYLGLCEVIHIANSRSGLIEPEHLPKEIRQPRVLLATGSYTFDLPFRESFLALAPATVDWLHARGVRLIGVDTPSVDPFTSKDLPAHNRFRVHDMAILEGLVLDAVPEGVYELIALPLRLVGFDASPVRAVLRTMELRSLA
jgi:arylformamidase